MEPAKLPSEIFRTDSPDRTLHFEESKRSSPDTTIQDTEKGKDKNFGLKDRYAKQDDVIAIADALDAIMNKLGVGDNDYESQWEKMRNDEKNAMYGDNYSNANKGDNMTWQNSRKTHDEMNYPFGKGKATFPSQEAVDEFISKVPPMRNNTREASKLQSADTWEVDNTVSTVKPLDSASMIKPHTATNMYSQLNPARTGSMHDDVIGGYEQNAESHLEEIEAISSIEKVYGLPKIFLNERLNFLVHLHKILEKILSEGRIYPANDSLSRILRYSDRKRGKSRNPNDELLYQVLKATVSQRSQKVKANPFNLPILEVGMVLNDKLVHMCFSELYAEYRREWFNSMKDIEPPKFHNSYQSYRTLSSSSSDSKSSQGRKKRTSHSILGI